MGIALGTSATQLKVGAGTVSRVYKGSTAFWDSDAAAYTAAVEAADGQSLELGVVAAYHNFILGCKADGIWDAIKAACLLCGARTLAGALVPLVGTAPTNNNFVDADYNRETGLKGNGSTKYLDSNRANNADGQNDNHQSAFLSSVDTRYASPIGMGYLGASNAASTSRTTLGPYANVLYVGNMCSSQAISSASASASGFLASSRASSSGYSIRSGGSDFSKSVASVSPGGQNHFVFGDNAAGSPASITDARLAFYSIGESISDLAAFDARVTALVTAIGAAL